jgi:hypothetical protein
MKKLRLLFLLVFIVTLISCGTIYNKGQVVSLIYQPVQNNTLKPEAKQIDIVFTEFSDARTSWDICNTFNTDGEVDSTWTSSPGVSDYIKNAIIKELSLRNIKVDSTATPGSPNILELKGFVRIFYSWPIGASTQSAVNIDLELLHNSYRVFYNSYYSDNVTKGCGPGLTQALRITLQKAADEIEGFLRKEAYDDK